MSKKESQIIDIISRYLPRCCTSATCSCYGDIPMYKFQNACETYAGYVDYSECIGLTDETIFGNGKRGFLFTLDGFYYYGCSSKRYYSDGISFKTLGCYNTSVMNEMLDQLYLTATKTTGKDILSDLAGVALTSFFEGLVEGLNKENNDDDDYDYDYDE